MRTQYFLNLKPYTPENKNMVNKGEKTKITTKMLRKSDKRSEKMFWLGQKKCWQKVPKVRKKLHFGQVRKKWKPSLAATSML